jgi:hypothetical protein
MLTGVMGITPFLTKVAAIARMGKRRIARFLLSEGKMARLDGDGSDLR